MPGRLPARPGSPPRTLARLLAFAVSFSDCLDKLVYHGVTLGGLSSLAWDPRSSSPGS
jgi:hypothetical protein